MASIGDNDIVKFAKQLSELKNDKSAIIDIINKFDDVNDAAKALKLGEVSSGFAQVALDDSKFAASAETAMQTYNNFSISFTSILKSMKDGLNSFGSNLLSFLTTPTGKIMAAVAAITTAIAAFKWADNKYNITKGTVDEKYENTSSGYSKTLSELDSLNSQLENTQSRINELNAMENLSLVDQAELNNLQRQNELLEAQIAIKQKIADTQQKTTAESAKNKLEYKQARFFEDWGKVEYVDAFDAAKSYIDELETIENRRDALIKEQATLEPEETLFGISQYERNVKEINELDSRIINTSEELASHMNEVNDTVSSFYEADGVTPLAGYENLIDRANSLNDYYLLKTDIAQSQVNKINSIFAKAKYENVEDQLIEAGKTGGKDAVLSKISEIDGLSDSLDNAGVSAENLADQMMSIADPDAKNIEGIKDNLNEIFKKVESEDISGPLLDGQKFSLASFFIGKSDKDLESFWDYYTDNNLDASDWNLEDLALNFQRSIDAAQATIDETEPITFSSLLSPDAEGSQSALSKQIDDFQSNMSSIQEAFTSIKNGEQINLTDLVQEFPELAGQTDDLQEALTNLSADKITEFASKWKAAVNDLDDDQAKIANDYFSNLLSNIDLSGADIDALRKQVTDKIWSGITGGDSIARAQSIMDEFGKELQTDEGVEILWKLLLDPANANATAEDFRAQYDGEEINMELRISNKALEELQNKMSLLQSEASVYDSEMSLKEATGQKVTANDYLRLIANSQKQIENLKAQNDEKIYQQGLPDISDEKYASLQEEINSNIVSINNARQSQLEWNEAIKNLPVTNAQNLVSAISSAMSEIQSDTGLTADTIDNLKTQFSDLENSDPSDLFYNSAEGIKVNTSALEDMIEQQNKIQSSKFRDEIKRQKEEIKAYQDVIGSGNTDAKLQAMQNNLEGLLQRQSQYYAQYKAQMEQLSDFQAMQDAKNTANAGSHYDQLLSDIKTAKEAYDKNLVGTDDFKTVAKYLSPNGFEDAANFAENYAKAERYLTEDSKGVVNFLNDLNKKGYATYETLANGVKQWSLNIQDAKEAAYDMGMGEGFFTDVLNKTEDYGFVNATVTSLEEGTLKTEEANAKLVEAYAKLAEMQASGAPAYAIEQQQEVVSSLEDHVNDLTDATRTYQEVSAQSYAEGLTNLKEQVGYLNEARKAAEKSGNTQLAEGLGKKIQSLANEYGVTLTVDDFEIDENSYNRALKESGIFDEFKGSVDLTNRPVINSQKLIDMGYDAEPDGIATVFSSAYSNSDETKTVLVTPILPNGDVLEPDSLDEYASQILETGNDSAGIGIRTFEGEDSIQQANSYAEALHLIQEGYYGTNESQKEALNSLKDYTAEELHAIDYTDGAYSKTSERATEAEKAVDALCAAYGITGEQAHSLIDVMSDMQLLKPQINVDTTDIQAGTQKLQEMQEAGEITTDIDFSVNVEELTSDELSDRLGQLEALKAGFDKSIELGIDVDTDAYDAVVTMIDQTTLQMKINAAIEEAGGIDELLALGEEGIQTVVGCDDSEVDGVIAKLEEMANGENIPVTVQMEETQFNQLLDSQNTSTITIDANNEPAKEKIDEAVDYGDSQTTTITIDGDNGPAKAKIDAAVRYGNSRTSTITVGADTSGITSAINSALSGSFSINVSANVSGLPQQQSCYTGTMSSPAASPAHAYGAAYMINYKNAYSNGKVALDRDEVALVNELGQESIIRGDKWMLLPPGMHTQALKKGDIVLNAQQTSDLRKYGKAKGHARALAQGTVAYSGMPARATTGGGTIGGNKYTTGTGSSSSTSSSLNQAASNLNNAASNLSSAAASTGEAAEDTKEAFDYIAIKLDRLQSKYDDYIRQAEDATRTSHKIMHYNQANKVLSQQIATNQKGATRYLEQAKSVGLDESIAKKIRNGTIDIVDYDDDMQEKISEYQKWYELALDCKDAVKELKIQQKELAQTKIDVFVDKYKLLSEYADARISVRQGELDYRDTAGYSNVSARQKYLYQDSIKAEEYKLYRNQLLTNNLKNELEAQLKSGVIKKYDDQWREAQIQIREFDQAIYESKTAIAEYNQEIRAMKTTRLQRLFDAYSRWAEQLKGIFSLKEARGQNVTESDYMKQVTANNNQIITQDALLADYLAEQATYEYGSEKWVELAEKISDAKNSINELLVANEELKDSVVEERWEAFTKLQDEIDNTVVELDYLRNTLNDSIDALGNITDDGFTNITLIGKAMTIEKQKIADYNEALLKLNEDFRNGNIDQTEYTEKQREFQQVIRESATAVDDYEDELIELWTTQIEARNEALQEEIDLRKKALEDKKAYHDYDKNLRSQTKELDILNAQAAALEDVSDAASKAKLAKTKAQIEEAKEKLADTKYEHTYDLKVTGYETLKDDLQKQLDDTLDDLKVNAELQQNVVNAMLGNIKTGYETAYTGINDLIKDTGISISDSATQAVESFGNLAGAIDLVADAIRNIPSYDSSKIAADIDTTKIVTNQGSATTDSSGNKVTPTTDQAESDAAKKPSKTNATTLAPSNQGTQSGKATSIKLNKTSLSLKVGDSATLKVTASPANAATSITWKSSNTNVATVSGGTVKAKTKGSVTITATDSKSGKAATCKVKVTVANSTISKTPTTTAGTSSNVWSGIAKDTSMKGNKSLNVSQSIVDRMSYNGYASDKTARTQLWKNLKGSGTYSGTAAQNIWMLNKLKSAGYAKGGIVDKAIRADAAGMLGDAIMENGDKAFIGINPGEYVLPQDISKNMGPALETMKNFTDSANKTSYYSVTGQAPVINFDSLITVQGNVDKNVVDDLNSLCKQLTTNRSFMTTVAKSVDKQIASEMNKAGFVKRIR